MTIARLAPQKKALSFWQRRRERPDGRARYDRTGIFPVTPAGFRKPLLLPPLREVGMRVLGQSIHAILIIEPRYWFNSPSCPSHKGKGKEAAPDCLNTLKAMALMEVWMEVWMEALMEPPGALKLTYRGRANSRWTATPQSAAVYPHTDKEHILRPLAPAPSSRRLPKRLSAPARRPSAPWSRSRHSHIFSLDSLFYPRRFNVVTAR